MTQLQPKAPARQPAKVLVIDDHLDTAHSLAILLREMGHEVEFAVSGSAALQIARRFRPQIVFVDMHLPDFDGSDLSRLLRIQAEPEPLRVIAVTGRRGGEERRRALHAGCDEFLLKPLDWTVLERLLSDG